MKFFGDWHGLGPGPGAEDGLAVATPVGQPCIRCGEPVAAGESGVVMPQVTADGQLTEAVQHGECHLRGVLGSVAHQKRLCSCFGGSGEDDPTLTVREAARAAVAYAEQQRTHISHHPIEDAEKLYTFADWYAAAKDELDEYYAQWSKDPNEFHAAPHTYVEWMKTWRGWASW